MINNKSITINYVSAGCGQGKTYSACQYINKMRHYNNWIYVAPTIILLQQTEQELLNIGVVATRIDTSNSAQPTRSIVEHLKDASRYGNVLLITWAAFSVLPYFHHRQHWKIIIDEIPVIDTFRSIRIPYNSVFIREHAQITLPVNETIGVVEPIDSEHLEKYLSNKSQRDDVYALFHDLLRDIYSNNHTVFVDLKSWNEVYESNSSIKKRTDNNVYFLSLLNPEMFHGSTLLGANIEESMFYDWFTRFHQCTFKKHTGIYAGLRDHCISQCR